MIFFLRFYSKKLECLSSVTCPEILANTSPVFKCCQLGNSSNCQVLIELNCMERDAADHDATICLQTFTFPRSPSCYRSMYPSALQEATQYTSAPPLKSRRSREYRKDLLICTAEAFTCFQSTTIQKHLK